MTRRRREDQEGLGAMTLERRAQYIIDSILTPARLRAVADELARLDPGDATMSECDALAEARRRGGANLDATVDALAELAERRKGKTR
jgi:hypothetical protein